jgi:O-antigen/teichoic acid export membrane protein
MPADYGLIGIYMVFCALLGTLSTMQFQNAIITADDEETALTAFNLSLFVNTSFFIVLSFLILIFRHQISSLYNTPDVERWLIFAPVSTFSIGLNSVLTAWAIRKRKFKIISINRIFAAIIAPIFSILLGVFLIGPLGLFIGLFISQIVPTITLSAQLVRKEELKVSFDIRRMKAVAKKFRNYPIFSLPAEFINNFANQIPLMILGRTGGIQVVGWYNLSVRMLALPTTLISTSIADVFRQRASEDYFLYGTCRPIFMKVFKSLVLIVTPVMALLALFGPQLFSFVFGQQWKEAGVITQILTILYGFKFVASPLSYVTYIANKQWVGLLIDMLLLAILFAVYIVSDVYNLNYRTSLVMFSLSYAVLYFITFYLSYKFTVNDRIPQKAI